jgi:hypothetical protein
MGVFTGAWIHVPGFGEFATQVQLRNRAAAWTPTDFFASFCFPRIAALRALPPLVR